MDSEFRPHKDQLNTVSMIELPQAAYPRVSFDVNLGKDLQGRVINFDPESLDYLLFKLGLDEDERNVDICVDSQGKYSNAYTGWNDLKNKEIVILYDPKDDSNASKLNAVLKHEVSHCRDIG